MHGTARYSEMTGDSPMACGQQHWIMTKRQSVTQTTWEIPGDQQGSCCIVPRPRDNSTHRVVWFVGLDCVEIWDFAKRFLYMKQNLNWIHQKTSCEKHLPLLNWNYYWRRVCGASNDDRIPFSCLDLVLCILTLSWFPGKPIKYIFRTVAYQKVCGYVSNWIASVAQFVAAKNLNAVPFQRDIIVHLTLSGNGQKIITHLISIKFNVDSTNSQQKNPQGTL